VPPQRGAIDDHGAERKTFGTSHDVKLSYRPRWLESAIRQDSI